VRINKRTLVTLILVGLLDSVVVAQSFYDWKIQREWKVSLFGGSASYFGEPNPDVEVNFSPSAAYVGIQRNIWNRIDGRAELGAYYLRVIDERRADTDPDWRFSGTSFELNVTGIFYLWDESDIRYYERKKFNPYGILGAAVTYANLRIGSDGGRVPIYDLDVPEEDDYGPIFGAIIGGLGVRYTVNYLFNFSIEGAYRYVLSDGFDNHKNRASNTNTFNNDFYWVMGFRLETYLPPDVFKGKKSAKYGRVKWFRKFKKEAYWQN
jgi:hypothetical protein